MNRNAPLSTDLDDPAAVPYFLWDEPMTVGELRRRLATGSPPEKTRLLGRILREARDTEVWRFTSPADVRRLWPEVSRHLGRRRAFWEFLLRRWREAGLLQLMPEKRGPHSRPARMGAGSDRVRA